MEYSQVAFVTGTSDFACDHFQISGRETELVLIPGSASIESALSVSVSMNGYDSDITDDRRYSVSGAAA